MKTALSKSGKRMSKIVVGIAALAVVLSTGFATPAKADWHRGPHGHHVWHDRGWHPHERVVVQQPGYVYAPPPTVYYPPPASPGINLILPLHFN